MMMKQEGRRALGRSPANDCKGLGKYNSPQSKKEGKDQESTQSSTTPDPGYQWECDNITMRHHKREPRGQPFSSR